MIPFLKKNAPYALLGALALIVAANLTGCSLIDQAAGSGKSPGWLPRLFAPIQSVPGPIGLGADVLVALCGIWAAVRGKNWKKAATDGIALFDKLKQTPEGARIWAEDIKPRLDGAKSSKDYKAIMAIIGEVKEILASFEK